MPISYRIDTSLGLLTVIGEGDVTGDDLTVYKDTLMSDPALRHVRREISDFRGTSLAVPARRLPEVARLHVEVFAGAEPTRCAVLVSSDLQYGLARMYARCVGKRGHEVVPFRSMAEARRWLGLPEASEPA